MYKLKRRNEGQFLPIQTQSGDQYSMNLVERRVQAQVAFQANRNIEAKQILTDLVAEIRSHPEQYPPLAQASIECDLFLVGQKQKRDNVNSSTIESFKQR